MESFNDRRFLQYMQSITFICKNFHPRFVTSFIQSIPAAENRLKKWPSSGNGRRNIDVCEIYIIAGLAETC